MTKPYRISYLYFTTAVMVSLYAVWNGQVQTLNIGDTYFVVPPKDFGVFAMALFGCIGLTYWVIEKQIKTILKLTQFFSFTIPFVYFMLSDFIQHDPGYSILNPTLAQWETNYIPKFLLVLFLASISIYMYSIIVVVRHTFKNNSATA